MKSLALLTAIVALTGCPASKSSVVATGAHSAQIDALDAPGGKLPRGEKLTVMSLGASWCKPCRKELPAWDNVAEEFAGQGVQFIAVSIDEDQADGKRFFQELALRSIAIAYDPKQTLAETLAPPKMPTTYLLNARDEVVAMHPGYKDGDAQKLRELILAHL